MGGREGGWRQNRGSSSFSNDLTTDTGGCNRVVLRLKGVDNYMFIHNILTSINHRKVFLYLWKISLFWERGS